MKLNSTMVERLIAAGIAVVGVLMNNYTLACLGIMYLVFRLSDD